MNELETTRLSLRSGKTIPAVGLGVWRAAAGHETHDAVSKALALGYRHVDTARIYGNETDVGRAVRSSGVSRDAIYVTTKLWNDDHGYDAALRAFDASLERLGLEYVDLHLVHWPVAGARAETWRAMERIAESGRARSIGVSNYLVPHLEELFQTAKILPEVNQIELHPFLQHREAVALCKRHGIVVQAYSPLTRGRRLDDPVIARIAARLGRTPAQVILRWNLEHGNVILPKSVREERMRENAGALAFTLDPASLGELDALDEGSAEAWDPRTQK